MLHTSKQEIKRVQVPNSDVPVSQAVVVPPNASTIYLSGMLPGVSNKDAPKHSLEAFGDTETQTVSVLRRIEAALSRQDLAMGDIVQLKVFLVGDPRKSGSLDFTGFQAGYSKFFSTNEQPNKPVRSVLQIAGLALPGALVEIEATAAKVR
nr:RidA family protein [Pseudomonas sp. TH31]